MDVGIELHGLVERLYPFPRSITGTGVRETLKVLQEFIPLEIHEVPSGTEVFDWVVPDEWNVKEAYIKNAAGERIVDFRESNLQLVHYSVPMHERMGLQELKKHLHSLPEHPDWVPYRTAYHSKTWGFCLSHNQLLGLEEEEYEVCIDATLEPGSLSYGELVIKGESDEEVLFSVHICHPSLCNDNLSGIAIATLLARELASLNLKYSYRFLFIPGTIGSITWLCLNKEKVKNIKHGMVLALLGDEGRFHYKKSRRGDAGIDRLVCRVLNEQHPDYEQIDFYPYGYDERQYCSPGFNLPVGRLSRTPHGQFPEYHTSADNLDFVRPEKLAESYRLLLSIVRRLESAVKYINLKPECEPMLGKRGLYKQVGGQNEAKDFQMALLWILNLSDGEHSLGDIADRSGLDMEILREAADELLKTDLLEKR